MEPLLEDTAPVTTSSFLKASLAEDTLRSNISSLRDKAHLFRILIPTMNWVKSATRPTMTLAKTPAISILEILVQPQALSSWFAKKFCWEKIWCFKWASASSELSQPAKIIWSNFMCLRVLKEIESLLSTFLASQSEETCKIHFTFKRTRRWVISTPRSHFIRVVKETLDSLRLIQTSKRPRAFTCKMLVRPIEHGWDLVPKERSALFTRLRSMTS